MSAETLDVLYKLALFPADVASEALGVKGSTFKKRLRAIGIARWPYRRFKGVVDSYAYVAHVLANTLKSLEFGLDDLEQYSENPCSTNALRSFQKLDLAVEELRKDLTDLEAYAYALERSFLHTGQVETVTPSRALVRLQGKVYKHRSSISKYTRRVLRDYC